MPRERARSRQSIAKVSRRDFLNGCCAGVSAIGLAGIGNHLARGSSFDSFKENVARELAGGANPIPGAVVMVGTPERILLHEAVGWAQLVPNKEPMRLDSIFDVASVTKVVATATACGICVDRGLLDPDAPLTKYLPEHQGKGVEKIPLRRLASHTSGFAANPRLYTAGKGPALFEALLAESPKWEVNTRYEYACKNIVLLSTIVERVARQSFGDFCRQEIFTPLGMRDSAFNQVEPSPRVVGTHVALGVSHNKDTIAAGRPIGNAGLFTTAPDLGRFCRMMLGGGVLDGQRILSEKVIADFTKTNQLPQFFAQGFIWKTDPTSPHRPSRFSEQAFGHGGYTGQSMWLDPKKNLFAIVLSNRTHPKNDHQAKEPQLRVIARIADLAMEYLKL